MHLNVHNLRCHYTRRTYNERHRFSQKMGIATTCSRVSSCYQQRKQNKTGCTWQSASNMESVSTLRRQYGCADLHGKYEMIPNTHVISTFTKSYQSSKHPTIPQNMAKWGYLSSCRRFSRTRLESSSLKNFPRRTTERANSICAYQCRVTHLSVT